ncbi:MAG: glycosyltransferase [Bacteroidaceae bacterium]|nr:glycosyltransferase [Bacteroidaceae bacterium]
MRLLYNLKATQPIGNTKFHGGGKYGLIVFKRLVEIAPDKVAVYYDDQSYLDEDTRRIIVQNNLPVYLKNDMSLYDAARKESKVIYSPLFSGNYVPEDITIIQTQHGCRILEMSYDKYQQNYEHDKGIIYKLIRGIRCLFSSVILKRDIKRFQKRLLLTNIKTVTVSEHSKYSLFTFIPELQKQDLKVFYSPSTISENDSKSYISKNTLGKYYLVVSGNRWIKNGYRVLKAMDELFSEHAELEGMVVVTGLNSWKELKIRIRNKERFILMGYVDEKTLKQLYHNAHLFVYGSLNEGFGYPPLEAMHEGCPVITSAIASIPEICGDAVLYFNPYSIPEIKMRIVQMENSDTRLHYIEKGRERHNSIKKKQDEDLNLFCKYLISFVS